MAIKKVESNKRERLAEERRKKKEVPDVSLDDQIRLAEILNDSPRLSSLNGTEWEIRALRAGTQNLIAAKVLEISKNETDSFGDIVRHFAKSVPATLHIFTLALLNDKNKIYKDGNPLNGYSDLYKETYETLEWDCDPKQFGQILIDTLSLLDISFFSQSLDMLDIFRQSVTKKKRMRKKKNEQK